MIETLHLFQEASKTDVASAGETDMSAMTSGERSKWASFRETFFSKGTNRHSLHLIEQVGDLWESPMRKGRGAGVRLRYTNSFD